MGSIRGERYYQKELFELIQDSVQKQMMSDVPVGAFERGVDSTSIVALMSKYKTRIFIVFRPALKRKAFLKKVMPNSRQINTMSSFTHIE